MSAYFCKYLVLYQLNEFTHSGKEQFEESGEMDAIIQMRYKHYKARQLKLLNKVFLERWNIKNRED